LKGVKQTKDKEVKKGKIEEPEKTEEVEEVEDTEEDGEEEIAKEEVKKEEIKKEKPTPTYRNGTAVMAKVQGKISKNLWFNAKVISSRPTALGPFEYHVIYTDEAMKDTKEWVPERFLTLPINTDTPQPPSSLVSGI